MTLPRSGWLANIRDSFSDFDKAHQREYPEVPRDSMATFLAVRICIGAAW